MFDNIHTKFKDTKIFITEVSAPSVIEVLRETEAAGKLTAETCAYLSKAYVYASDDDLALAYALKSIEMDPTYPYGYLRAAFSYARAGVSDKALKYARLADMTLKNPNNYITAFLIVIYNYCGEEDMAKEKFAELKQVMTGSPEDYYCMGFIYSQEEPEKAIKWFLKAEEKGYADKYNLWSNLAENYSLLENFEKTEYYADKCLEIGESRIPLKLKAEVLKEKDEYDEALIFLRRKYKVDRSEDNKLKTLSMIIYCFLYSKSPEKGERYIDFALKYFSPTYSLYYACAAYYEVVEDYDKAIEMYKKMLNFDENDGSALSSISYCYSQKGDEEKALEYADMALMVSPEDSYVYYRKGRVLAALKDYNGALNCFLKSLDYNATDVDSFQWISYCYSMLKMPDKSLEYANRAILLDKTDCYSYFRKAWAYQELGRYTEAITYYKECINCDDRYVDAYLNISYIYSKLGDSKQALLFANKALLINKDYSYAHYRKAMALQESGRYEEAYDGYSKAIELDPTDIYNYLGIACIALNNQESSDALLYANKAIFLDRNCGGAYYYKSLALSNLGKIKEAEAAYAKAIELGYLPG